MKNIDCYVPRPRFASVSSALLWRHFVSQNEMVSKEVKD